MLRGTVCLSCIVCTHCLALTLEAESKLDKQQPRLWVGLGRTGLRVRPGGEGPDSGFAAASTRCLRRRMSMQ